MRRPLSMASGTLVAALSLASPASALDPEFEALRAAARQHEASQAAKPAAPRAPAAKPAGPNLAAFVPPAPKGWRLRSDPYDDAEGLVDLTRQASGRYSQASGSGGPALEITLLAKSDLIGGGVPKLGRDPMSGSEISEVSVAGHVGYMSWQTGGGSGKLTLSVGRYLVLVDGRHATPQLLIQFASLVNLARLKGA